MQHGNFCSLPIFVNTTDLYSVIAISPRVAFFVFCVDEKLKKSPKTRKNAHFPCVYQKFVVSLRPNLRRSRVMRRMVVGSLHIDGVY